MAERVLTAGESSERPAARLHIIHGDCLEVMPTLPADSFDAIVTDPPYGLTFMGKDWDHGSPGIPFWSAALRVAKPGAHLAAFGGTRTFHRLACAIEDAGWEIRDCLMWLYGSGFPKSLNGAHGGTALKPAYEPIILARKPLDGTVAANFGKHGTGGLRIDECRIGTMPTDPNHRNPLNNSSGNKSVFGIGGTGHLGEGRWPANVLLDEESAARLDAEVGTLHGHGSTWHSGSHEGPWGWGKGPHAQNGGEAGGPSRFFYTAKASRSEREAGLEGMEGLSSRETVGRDPDSAGAHNPRAGAGRGAKAPIYRCRLCGLNLQGGRAATVCPIGERHERELVGHGAARRNVHPTVKPLDLMRWLCRLITPVGGHVLDPFAGSGTTGCAAAMEGLEFTGIEREQEYVDIARRRIAHWSQQETLPL